MPPYLPERLPLQNIEWTKFIHLIGPANAELARYDGILKGMINPQVLLSPLTINEAVLSSKIEGTQATLEEVLEFEAHSNEIPDTERQKDIQEIINYRKAMRSAISWLSHKPITLNLIKETHGILLDSVRGRNKDRGNLRTIQNFIGLPNSTIETAQYIPPSPFHVMEYMDNLEKYIHYEEKDKIVQCSLIHAQFEIIHPFLDGNGRLGRMLVPLFLFEKQIISSPMFYISEYFERNRDHYYYFLGNITKNQKWNEWIEFFLKAIIEQAKINSEKALSILKLYNQKKDKISSVTRSQYVIKILDTLFISPIFSSSGFTHLSGIPKPSAQRILQLLEKENIISPLRKGSGRRSTVYIFKKLVNIVR